MKSVLKVCVTTLLTISSHTAFALGTDAFEFSGGVFFRLPQQEKAWVAISDQTQTCSVLHETQADHNGVIVRGDEGTAWFLSNWGMLYSKNNDGQWQITKQGAWMHQTLPGLGWNRSVMRDGASVPESHSMVWSGTDLTFVNDPRFGENSYYPEPRFKKSWLSVAAQRTCKMHQEVSRTYGAVGTQTIVLEPSGAGEPQWTIATGRARFGTESPVVGDWLKY